MRSILFNFANDASQPWTPAYVQGVVFSNSNSVAAYYQEVSYGQEPLTGDVFGWYTISDNNSGCRADEWAAAARAAATGAGVNLSAYDNVVYAFPKATSCGWSGMAALRGSTSWINGSMTLRTVGHELGHNFGAHHASSYRCTEGGVPVALSATCTAAEYGDPFSIMGGAASRHQHGLHRTQSGWLADGQTVTAGGTYLVSPVELAGSPHLLRIARGDGKYFYLEYRQPFGFDSFSLSDPAVNGVTIRLAPDFNVLSQSLLIDTIPSTSSFSDAPLAIGRTFSDAASGVSISTVAVSSVGARVAISFGASTDTQAPTAPPNLSAQATSSTTVSLSWSSSSDNVAVSGYRVYRDGTLVATTGTTSFADSGLAAGTTHTYAVAAFDAAGNSSSQSSADVTLPSADLSAPTAPTGLNASIGKGRKVSLSWSASTDNVAVAGYRVYRDGAMIATTSARSFTETLPRKATGATYTTVAFDAAGNVSPPSNSASVTS